MTSRVYLTFAAAILTASTASAQVVVRVPFVRVETGGPAGTYVRAPFVNLFVPAGLHEENYQLYLTLVEGRVRSQRKQRARLAGRLPGIGGDCRSRMAARLV